MAVTATTTTTTTTAGTDPSLFGVLARSGTTALLRFVGALLLFTVLHLVRLPLVLLARVLELSMRRVDAYVTGHATTHTPPSPPGPTGPGASGSTWFTREEEFRVYAA